MFILNGSATLSVPAMRQASHLSSPAAPLGTAPAGEATGSWFRDSFVGKAWYNPQTSTIQKLQGGNALFSFVIGIFTGTLTNPLTLLSIALGGAAFFLGITNPGLILACAAVGVLQALGSAKDTLHSVKENGLFSLSTLMSAGGTALSAFCVMPGIGNLGNALKIAHLRSLKVVPATPLTNPNQLTAEVLNKTKEGLKTSLTRVETAIENGNKALNATNIKILDIAKIQGHTATEVNKQLLKDLEKQLVEKIKTAAEEAKKELQKTLIELRRLAADRGKINAGIKHAEKLKTQLTTTQTKIENLSNQIRNGTITQEHLDIFNQNNLVLMTDYNSYTRVFLTETYGAQGAHGYDQIKGIVGKGKAKYTNWKGDAPKSSIVDTPQKPPVEASVPRPSAVAPATVPSPQTPAFAPPPPPAYHEFRAPQPSTKPKTPLKGGIGASPPQPLISPEIASRFPPEGQYILKVNRQGVNGNYIWNTTTGKYDFVADLPIPNPSIANKIVNFLSGLGMNHPVRTMV